MIDSATISARLLHPDDPLLDLSVGEQLVERHFVERQAVRREVLVRLDGDRAEFHQHAERLDIMDRRRGHERVAPLTRLRRIKMANDRAKIGKQTAKVKEAPAYRAAMPCA